VIAYLVVTRQKFPERYKAVELSADLEGAKNSARKAAREQGVESYVFHIGPAFFHVDEDENERCL
jgi:hypothetical protein